MAGRIQAEANEQAALQARDQAEGLALDAFDGIRAAVEEVQAELSNELNRAMKAEAAAEERAIDAELATDELRNEIARLDAELARAEAMREATEQRFREERLRLVEAQEAGGSSEAYRKMEDMLAEIDALRRIRAEYEARFGVLDPSAS